MKTNKFRAWDMSSDKKGKMVYWEELKKLDPAAGLKDHTPGSVVPDRERTNHILDILKNHLLKFVLH